MILTVFLNENQKHCGMVGEYFNLFKVLLTSNSASYGQHMHIRNTRRIEQLNLLHLVGLCPLFMS